MKRKTWREKYSHIPLDFPRRVGVLQRKWGMTASVFAFRAGCTLAQINNYKIGRSMPNLQVMSKIEHAVGLRAVLYLVGRGRSPRRPDEPTGKLGPGTFEIGEMERRLRKRAREGK